MTSTTLASRAPAAAVPSLVRGLALLPIIQVLVVLVCVLAARSSDRAADRFVLPIIVCHGVAAIVSAALALAWIGRICRFRPYATSSRKLSVAAELLLFALVVALVRVGLGTSALGNSAAIVDLLEGHALLFLGAFELALRGAAFLLVLNALPRLVDPAARRDLRATTLRIRAWAALAAISVGLLLVVHLAGPRELQSGTASVVLELTALGCGLASTASFAALGYQIAARRAAPKPSR